MAFIDHLDRLNRYQADGYLSLLVDERPVGALRPAFADALRRWPALFEHRDDTVLLRTGAGDITQRSEPLARVVQELVTLGVIDHLLDEPYAVTPAGRDQALLLIDRGAAAYFGVRTFGQHLNGLVQDDRGLQMWIGRRSADRRVFPGCLDQLVAGGLPWGIELADNLAKECWEEAGIPRSLAQQARPVGAVSYRVDSERGLKPDTLYCYDLYLPTDFVQRCTDGEVEGFELHPIEQVMKMVDQGEAFKPNCNLVIIDCLIRHGYIGPQHPDYLALLEGLHRTPGFATC